MTNYLVAFRRSWASDLPLKDGPHFELEFYHLMFFNIAPFQVPVKGQKNKINPINFLYNLYA